MLCVVQGLPVSTLNSASCTSIEGVRSPAVLERILQQAGAELHRRSILWTAQEFAKPFWSLQGHGAGIVGQLTDVSFYKDEENQTILEWRREAFQCLQPFGHPSLTSCEAPKHSGRNQLGNLQRLLSILMSIWVSPSLTQVFLSIFLPGMRPLTSWCSGDLPLFSSTYIKPGNLPSRN